MQLKTRKRLLGFLLLGGGLALLQPWVLDGAGYQERHLEVVIPPPPEFPAVTTFRPQYQPHASTAEPAPPVRPLSSIDDEKAGQAGEALSLEQEEPQLDQQGVPVAWTLQLASFKEEENAVALRDRLLKDGYQAYLRQRDGLHKVFVGPDIQRSSLERVRLIIRREYRLDGLILRFTTG